MVITFNIKYTGAVPGSKNFTRREWNEIVREAWYEVGLYWAHNMLPKHFTKEGAREYGYKPRDGETSSGSRAFFRSYTGKKQKYMHHTLPLVWSGELRDSTKDFRIEATATSNGSRVRIVLPSSQKANFKNQFTNINMREELTTVSPKEGEELSEILSKAIQRRVNATGQTCNVTIN